MSTNVVVVVVVLGFLVVIRFLIPKNFFISHPIVIKLCRQVGDNIIHNRLIASCRIIKSSPN